MLLFIHFLLFSLFLSDVSAKAVTAKAKHSGSLKGRTSGPRTSKHEPEEEVCLLENSELPSLQVLFLVDAGLSGSSAWPQIQRNLTSRLVNLFDAKYKAEYAVATYNSWKNPATCYSVLKDFVPDGQKAVDLVNSVEDSGATGDVLLTESSFLMALMMAMGDTKNLKWNQDHYSLSRKAVRKVIVTFPLRISTLTLDNPGDRKEPKGDGSDTCENSLPPSGDLLRGVAEYRNMFVAMVGYEYARQPAADFLKEFYDEHAYELDYIDAIWYSVGETGEGFEEDDVKDLEFENHQNEIFKDIDDEVQKCDWTDPEPYNSLGI